MARSIHLVSSAATLSALTISYPLLAADCYVDNVDGSDTNNGTSETTPFKSISKLGTTCTTAKFKRGNVYNLGAGVKNLGIASINSVKTLTNYGDPCDPLPKFIKEHVNGSGGMIQVFSAITIDGLYLAGSKSGNAMVQLADGIGIMVGGSSTIRNCEITLCDIGIMTAGDNVKVFNNYIHDLSISVDAPPGVDPNQVGGAEGIFVNSSHVEVAYNRFINCSTAAQWVTNTNGGGVRCDGGATEVTVGYADQVTDVHIHHNFSYNSCGLFEVSSMPNPDDPDGSKGLAYTKGKFTDSEFHDNVVVDSGWISLLQINNTRLTNVRWENNTIVHHFLPTVDGLDPNGETVKIDMNDYASSYIQVIPFNSVSSGVKGGGVLEKGDVYWTNNLWYIDPQIRNFSPTDATHTSTDEFVKNIVIAGDKVFREDPGFVDVTSQSDPNAYDLKQGSAAIDVGTTNSDVTTDVPNDFAERTRPIGNAYDLGAFEYGASNSGQKTIGIISGCGITTGGAPNTGGVSSVGVGGAATGGKASVTGGTQAVTGSTASTGGSGAPVATGGGVGTGGKANAGGLGSVTAGGSVATAEGGQPNGTGGGQMDIAGGNAATGGAAVALSTAAATANQTGCSCRVPRKSSRDAATTLFGLLLLALGVRRHARVNRRAARRNSPGTPRRAHSNSAQLRRVK